MLLRSITKHVKDQNWFAVALDFFIVVAGILIAFQITNWNEGRQDLARQEVYLERLHNDFESIRERLSLHLEHYGKAIEGADYVLSLIRTDETDLADLNVDRGRLQNGVEDFTSSRIPPGSPATYIEMVSEGQLSGVRPIQLRNKLAEYDQLLGIVQELSRIVIDRGFRQSRIIYRHVELLSTMDADSLTGINLELISYDLGGMRSDKEFAISVTILRQDAMNSLGQRRFQLALIDEILEMLEEEIR